MHQVLACKSTLARQASSEHHECSGMICSRHMGEHSVARRTIKQCTGLMMMGWGCYQSCHKSMTQKLAHEQMHTAPYSRPCYGAQCIYGQVIRQNMGGTPCGTTHGWVRRPRHCAADPPAGRTPPLAGTPSACESCSLPPSGQCLRTSASSASV